MNEVKIASGLWSGSDYKFGSTRWVHLNLEEADIGLVWFSVLGLYRTLPSCNKPELPFNLLSETWKFLLSAKWLLEKPFFQ